MTIYCSKCKNQELIRQTFYQAVRVARLHCALGKVELKE